MHEGITTFVGLDVHKDSIAIAVAVAGREAPRFVGSTGASLRELLKSLSHLGKLKETLLVYEAGPSGYVLARQLRAHGYHCEVVAPTKIPRRAGDRIKTDRRDAVSLAHFARAGDLSPVLVPEETDEAIRDLSRAREDALRARMRARHQLKALLLRHGKHYPIRTTWTLAHERHLATVSFEHPAQNIAFTEYRAAVREAHERLERITAALREMMSQWRQRAVVEALMSLRGIDFVSAVTLVAELGDLRRFAHPKQLMSFIGLVPSESSSGPNRTQGSITRTGNSHARRILIEAAWSYRYPARIGREMQIRQERLPAALREISWRAQLRLCQRYRRFRFRGVNQNKACTAIARELTGFIWDLAKHVPAPSASI
jgi:transposase